MGRGNRQATGGKVCLQGRPKALLRRRIERVQGLVEQPERGRRKRHAGQRGAAALAGRQGAHLPGGQRPEIEGQEGSLQAIGAPTAQALGDHEIFGHRQVALEPVEMTEPGQPAVPGVDVPRDVRPLPTHRAGIRPDKAGQGAQQGRLAAAVAAGQRQQLARRQAEGQAAEHAPAATPAGQAFDLEEKGRHTGAVVARGKEKGRHLGGE